MNSTIETLNNNAGVGSTLLTGGSGSILPPVVYTAERSGDGEGDGREIAATVKMLEIHANGGEIVGLKGTRIVEIITGLNLQKRQARQRSASAPIGFFSLKHTVNDRPN